MANKVLWPAIVSALLAEALASSLPPILERQGRHVLEAAAAGCTGTMYLVMERRGLSRRYMTAVPQSGLPGHSPGGA